MLSNLYYLSRPFLSVLLLLATSCSLQPTDVQVASVEYNKAVIFDIDGTLTPNNISIFTARPDAAHIVNLYADKGYKIIYLSARNMFFQFNIPCFLKENGFPIGNIHVPQQSSDRDDFAAFKQKLLMRYQNKGWNLVAAYGDSTSDFKAYAAVGIDPEHIYSIKREGAQTCQPGPWSQCLQSWSEQVDSIE